MKKNFIRKGGGVLNNYLIMTDSSADIPQDFLDRYHPAIIPMVFEVGNEECRHQDPDGWDSKTFFDKLRNGATGRTSQIVPGVYVEEFSKVLDRGLDILYISLSSGLTSTLDSANLAANMVRATYPERKVYCVDSRCATGGQGLLVMYALQNQEKGMSLEENAAWVENNRLKICHWFTVDDLDFLKRGGRISPATAWIGGKLQIKPVLRIVEDGTLEITGKVRGSKIARQTIVGKFKESIFNPDYPYVYLCHGDAEPEANMMRDEILAAQPGAIVIVRPMSPVISIHTGPGVQSVIYYGSNRK
ncbi:MAG: DegV family protein [Blautia sp.]|nr:DegV family protein [Blautia sp.]